MIFLRFIRCQTKFISKRSYNVISLFSLWIEDYKCLVSNVRGWQKVTHLIVPVRNE